MKTRRGARALSARFTDFPVSSAAGSQGKPTTSDSRLAAIRPIVRTPPLSGRKALLARHLTSVAALALGLGMTAVPAGAQSVTATGNVVPGSAASPVWNVGGILVVGNTGDGTLTVEAGGKVSNTAGAIANEAGSTGTATVSGVGSTWINSGQFQVGSAGSATLTVEAGGKVSNTLGGIGVRAGSTGTATVSGAGSTWINSRQLQVGVDGDGALTVEAGGRVENTTGIIGTNVGSGAVTVSGVGSTWVNSDELLVGKFGSATLTVEAGGKVENTVGSIGLFAGVTGAVTVSGAGSTWTNSGTLYVGEDGHGFLIIKDGGSVRNVNGAIGNGAGSTGEATVQGGGIWTNSDNFAVGWQGDGKLTIADSGKVENAEGYIGAHAGSRGDATVSGAGSIWVNSGNLRVGANGSGALAITDGGRIENAVGFIGAASGSTGSATVSGAGSVWANSGLLQVGDVGRGTLSVATGGMVSAPTIGLGVNSGSVGTINIGAAAGDPAVAAGTLDTARVAFGNGTATLNFNHSGATTFTAALSSTGVGTHALNHYAGTTTLTGDSSGFAGTMTVDGGTLAIASGGKLGGSFGYIARAAGSDGAVKVSGAGSVWANSGDLHIGAAGNGFLTVADGGEVSNAEGYIGTHHGATGTVAVSGAGSMWENTGAVLVGLEGEGTLTIADGGRVRDAYGIVGYRANSKGQVTVAGAGSSWGNSRDLHVGDTGDGTLTVATGGTVSAPTIGLGVNSGSVGTINIGAAAGDPAVAAGTLDAARVEFGAGTARLNFNHSGATTFTAALTSTGAGTHTLRHYAGTTTLTGDSSGFIGTTTVNGGTLAIASGGKLGGSTGYVGSAAGSDGAVTVSGAGSTWANSGTLAVGASGRGTLTAADGGRLESETGYIGYNAGATGAVTVSGAGSIWANSTGLTVGNSGRGTLAVVDGGKVESLAGSIGLFNLSAGAVTVTGSGSSWLNSGNLAIGANGTGTLTVADGGSVGAQSMYLAFGGTSTGTINVGSALGDPLRAAGTLNATDIRFGAGEATLNFNHSGATTFTAALVSAGADTHALNHYAGTTTLTGDSSGFKGITTVEGGTLAITSGGKLGGGFYTYVGSAPGSDGTAIVSGPGSFWGGDGAVALYVGEYGKGTLTVAEGGRIEHRYTFLSSFEGSTATVTITGPNSIIHASNTLFFGAGIGSILIENGGQMLSNQSFLGWNDHANATVTVSGPGSVFTNTDVLFMAQGDASTATLTIADGGLVVAKNVWIASGSVASATINIGGVPGDPLRAAGTLDAATVEFRNGPGTLNFNHSGATTFTAALTGNSAGAHALDHYAGTTTLTGDSSGFRGTTTVSGGTLVVADALGGSAHVTGGTLVVDGSLGGAVDARTGGVLSGHGSIAGNADLTGGGVLAGTQGQTLRIAGHVDMDATSAVDVTLGGPSVTALFDVGGDLTLDGTLNVADAGFGPGVYRLFDYAGTLTDNGLGIGSTPSGVGAGDLFVQTAVGHQVNLIATAGMTLGFWDGGTAGLHDNGAVDGGAGTWRADNRNWTLLDGSINGPFQPIPTYAVFQGTGGVVTVDDAAGAIGVTGMQFGTDGYRLEGDAVALLGAGGESIIRVGDGTAAAAGMTATIAAALTGSSTLVKQEEGTLVLTGANAYGGTRVLAGTLVGSAASISGDIANAATVVFEQGTNASFAGDITGSGAMRKRGAGTLALTGTSTLGWSVEAGGLLTDAGRFGGDVALAAGTTLTFDQLAETSYGGVLSGSGAFAVGGAAVTLTGNSSAFAGTTTVVPGGGLIVGTLAGGALGGSITIGAGSLLGGTGTVGSAGSTVTIAAGGVHAPGNSIGVQQIAGDYVNHGTLRIEATPTEADRIVVAGSVDITGATLELVLSPSDAAGWDVFNGPHVVIDKQSAGAVAGTFAQPYTQNLLFLDALVAYDGGNGNDVTLELVRNDLAFAEVGRTPNQTATGEAVDTLGNTHPVWRSIAATDDQDIVRASFDALSGEIHGSVQTAMIEDSRFVRNAINDRIRAAFDGVGASLSPVLAYGPGDTPMLVAPDHDGLAFWVNGFGSWGTTDSDGNAASLMRDTGGLLVGADTLVGDWRIGLVTGYSHSSLRIGDRASSASSDNYHVGLYGGTQWGDLAFRTGAAYTWHDVDTMRSVAIPGIAESLSGGYHAGTFQAFGELGYGFEAGATRFEPFANLAHVSLRTGGFGEAGGNAALTGTGGSTDVTFTTLGLRVEHGVTLGAVDATLKGMAGWRHAFGDTTPTSTHAFSAGDAFSIAGVPIARDAAIIEAGLDLSLSPDATFGLSYSGQIASGAHDHGFKANLNIRF